MPKNYFFSQGRAPYFKFFSLCLLSLALCACQFAGFGGGKRLPEVGSNKNPCVVLALPASGPYATFANKIKRGASLALNELKNSGISVRLENIDTEAPDWLARLDALPENCAVVGGPLREKIYLDARKAGATDKKAFFTFLPSLQPGEEGVVAWRFFPSPQDQVDALTKFGVEDMNIGAYAAFYPDDSYGQRMTSLFEKNLAARNIALKKASYNPKAPNSWRTAMSPLINPEKMPYGSQVIPRTDFDAVFLPDSWKNMDKVTNSLLASGEDRLLLLGTTLWEPALSGKQIANAAKYELAVFPGAWNVARAPKKLQEAKADFWIALGFDFVNFAAWMGLPTKPDFVYITTMAQKASPKIRGLAPIIWDNDGRAAQRLYLFQIASPSIKPLDIESLKRSRTNAIERAALRFQKIRDEGAVPPPVDEEPAYEPASVAPAEPTVAPAPAPRTNQPPLSATPQPSYKLRLPAKR